MVEYRITSISDSAVLGKFDLAALETQLNEAAADGWRLAEGLLATSPMKSGRAELVMVMERDRSTQ